MAKRRRKRRGKKNEAELEAAMLKKAAAEREMIERRITEKEMRERQRLERREMLENQLIGRELIEKEFKKQGIDLCYEEFIERLEIGNPTDNRRYLEDTQGPFEVCYDNQDFYYPGYQYIILDDDTEESEEEEIEEEPIITDSEDCLCSDNSDFEDVRVLSEPAKFMKETFKAVLDDLVRDFCESLCFDVHRSLSLNYFDATHLGGYDLSSDEELQLEAPTFDDIFGFQKGRIHYPLTECEVCKTKVDVERYLQHLIKCMGGGRKCTRGRACKIDYSCGTRRKRKNATEKVKKEKPKVKIVRKSYIFPAPSEPLNYEDLAYDEMQFFFQWHCGVISELTGFVCRRSVKCDIHTNVERKKIRRQELRRCKENCKRKTNLD